jgi:glutathione S-transferase
MALEVYWASGSPFVWRVLLALELKRIPYESKLLEFSKGQHKSPEYLAMNPRGRVPTIKDGAYVLYESVAILAYLERKHSDVPLFGRTAEETGVIWRHVSECESYLRDPVIQVARPIFTGQATSRPDEIRAAADTVHGELARYEATAGGSPWLAGDSISAADVAVFPLLQVLGRAATRDAAKPLELGFAPLADRYPKLAEWVRRVEALPGYERTYPPHWR